MPRDPAIPLFVYEHVSPAWSNVDFDPQLEAFAELDRAFVERQIERTHRDDLLSRVWSVAHVEGIPLAGPSLFDAEASWEVLLLEVPVLTVDRTHVVLRGQSGRRWDGQDVEATAGVGVAYQTLPATKED